MVELTDHQQMKQRRKSFRCYPVPSANAEPAVYSATRILLHPLALPDVIAHGTGRTLVIRLRFECGPLKLVTGHRFIRLPLPRYRQPIGLCAAPALTLVRSSSGCVGEGRLLDALFPDGLTMTDCGRANRRSAATSC